MNSCLVITRTGLATRGTAVAVLAGISLSHLLNDTVQALVPAIYPMLKAAFSLSFAQVGLMTLAQQLTASVLQPLVGLYTDRRPMPYSLVIGMAFTLVGLLLLAAAPTFGIILAAALLMGIGSAVFHPESSRVARMASGGRHGWRNRCFRWAATSARRSVHCWAPSSCCRAGSGASRGAALLALAGIAVLWKIGGWHREWRARVLAAPARGRVPPAGAGFAAARRLVAGDLAALIFSKYFYLASLSSYYTFYLIEKFHLSVRTAQIQLFVFLAAVAVGTIVGGPIGDRIGRKLVIWVSILGSFRLPCCYRMRRCSGRRCWRS
jgi:FSR family fosmidomycin resistance protein-like MFS transporter